jgi:hypothetical protein
MLPMSSTFAKQQPKNLDHSQDYSYLLLYQKLKELLIKQTEKLWTIFAKYWVNKIANHCANLGASSLINMIFVHLLGYKIIHLHLWIVFIIFSTTTHRKLHICKKNKKITNCLHFCSAPSKVNSWICYSCIPIFYSNSKGTQW